jgi:uncharacterized protein YndB with AHSA1/START domain
MRQAPRFSGANRRTSGIAAALTGTINMAGRRVGKRDLTVVRTYNVTLDLVWRAWSDPEQVKGWWGPNYFISTHCAMDFRVGGKTLISTRSPGGPDIHTEWRYQRIEPMKRIEFIQNRVDEHGAVLEEDFADPESATPRDIRTVAVFKALGPRTMLTVTEHDYPSNDVFRWEETRLEQTLDRLGTTLQYPKGEMEWQT